MLLCGLGTTLGVVAHLVLRSARDPAEETALLLGTVALSAGLAEYLALSGPVVCALAGVVLANLPLHGRAAFPRTLRDVERPLYLVFLLVVGAWWQPGAWQAWVLAAAYLGARVAGKWLAAHLAVRLSPELPAPNVLVRFLVPQGPVAVLVMAAAATLHGGAPPAPILWAIHAVVVGVLATEVLVHVHRRRGLRAREAA